MSEEQQAQPQLALERIYTKDISFEVPGAQVFTKEWQPELNINLSSSAEKIDPTHFEVALKVVVQANNDSETAFIVDVTQSGIFLIDNIEEDRRLAYVGITRAQTELSFVLCKERRQFGETINPEPSRFLMELPQDDLQWEMRKPAATAEQRQQKGKAGIANLRAMLKDKP